MDHTATHRNLLQRVLSALVLVPLAVAALWAGGWYFWALCLLFSIAAGIEYYGIVTSTLRTSFHTLVAVLPIILFVLAGTDPQWRVCAVVLPLICLVAMVACLINGGKVPILCLLGPVYTALPMLGGVAMRNDVHGVKIILYILGIVWGADIGGYLFGKMIGGAKLAPRISPAKTWAGAIGGLGTSCVLAGLVVVAMPVRNLYPLLAAIPVLSVVSQAGDLLESALKRYFGVKNSGNIIPGHGGVLDRIDGLLMVGLVYGLMHSGFGIIGDWW